MNLAISRTGSFGWSLALGVILVFTGLLAIVAPFFAGIAASMFFGWLILVAGLTHLAYAWLEHGTAHILWQILIGVVYLTAALYMILHPLGGLLVLALVLATYIMLEGIIELALYIVLRGLPGSIWLLSDGVISLLLAALIFFHWPSSSFWALGTLVGVSLLMSGIARLTMHTRRRAVLLTGI